MLAYESKQYFQYSFAVLAESMSLHVCKNCVVSEILGRAILYVVNN